MDFTGKRVMVVGMARSGVAAAMLLCRHGALPLLVDQKSRESFGENLDALNGYAVEWHLGKEPEGLISKVDAIVISPGVPIQSSFVQMAKSMDIPVLAEVELAAQLAKGTLIAVSGTNGKTTTVTLLGEIFKNAGKMTHVAGNIGYPLSAAALESRDEDVVVAEISSFQLEGISAFHPKVAALLNITEDHLNRHGTMAEYIRMKERIFENQTSKDVAVLNYDDPVLREMGKRLHGNVAWFSRKSQVKQGAYIEDDKIMGIFAGEVRPVCEVEAVNIPGPHNLENALAATAVALAMDVPPPVIRHSLRTFTGVEHRIERVRTLGGVTYINDSKGTNVDSTIKAVETMKAPTVMILGGYDKHTDFTPLANAIVASGKIAAGVLIGETAHQIEKALRDAGFDAVHHAETLAQAVELARGLSVPGGNVLLSPACASFDMFSDYEQRGKVFKEIVSGLS